MEYNQDKREDKNMRRKWLTIVIIAIVVIAALAIGYHFYRVNALRSALKPLALEDELLFKEMLAVTKTLPNITLAELSEKTQKNIQARNEIVSKVKALNPYLYKKQVGLFLKLLELENEYARSLATLKRAWLAARTQPREEVITEVEEVQIAKQKPVYREKTFKRTLLKFREVVEIAQAASQEHLRISREILAFEKQNTKSLSSIIPKRNIIPLLEEVIREPGARDWGLGL
jgi:flagellar basal body-associated protein FliL